MIIKKMSCEQFAGVLDRELELAPGMNLVVGPNETGKSTMVDLIYQLLYKDSKLRQNEDFCKLYFPQKATGKSGDFVDGALVFETENGTYKLKKEWGVKGGSCRLTLPDGTIIKNEDSIRDELAQQLVYGKGIYDEMVFASQKRALTILQALFQPTGDKPKKTDTTGEVKKEIASTVSKAVAETGGVSISKVEAELNRRLLQYSEKWDFAADMPEGGPKRGISNKWSCAASTTDPNRAMILRAYYAKEEVADQQRRTAQTEAEVDKANAVLEKKKQDLQLARDCREAFQQFRSVLDRRNTLQNLINSESGSVKTMKEAAQRWPEACDRLNRAQALKQSLQQAQCKALYDSVRGLKDELAGYSAKAKELGTVAKEDVKAAMGLERESERLTAQLQGLNLTARIRPLSDIQPVVTTAEGTDIAIRDNEFQITEAVNITVPDVLELQLMPAGVDMDEVKTRLDEAKTAYQAILAQYGVANADELNQRWNTIEELTQTIYNLDSRVQLTLGDTDWDALKAEAAALPEHVGSPEAVKAEICTLCGAQNIDNFIGGQAYTVDNYTRLYTSPESLQSRLEQAAKDLQEHQALLMSAEDVPAEYSAITDADAYDQQLKDTVESATKQVDKAREDLTLKETELEDHTAEEYQEELLKKQAEFEETKGVYAHWKHIAEVVQAVKAGLTGNPMEDIEEKFRAYLSLLTGGSLNLGSLDEHLDVSVTSGRNRLSYETLSEGTRDTITLAFRLAMLEHLFPDGNGLAVFDDPFTDMDPERTAQACRLIQKFAEKNQVIFVTCDEKYESMLSGNVIPFRA